MLTNSIRQQITEFLAEKHPNVFILEMEMHQGNRNTLSLRVDSDEGISLDACAAVSKNLGPWLDESGFFDYDHGLEVSSPGATAPLLLPRQYPKHRGRELKIITQEGNQLQGILDSVSEESISICLRVTKNPVKGRPIKYAEEPVEIPFDHIQQANVQL
ncbi:MAG: hypothetical protein R3B47_17435 [Bacteroidia bacterium]